RQHAGELLSVSAERVGDETRRMLSHPARARAASLIEDLGLDHAVFGARRGSSAGALPRLSALAPDASWTTALAAWVVDRASGGAASFAALDAGTRSAQCAALRERLVLSNRELEALTAALELRERIAAGFDAASVAGRTRLAASIGFDDALDLLALDRATDAARWRRDADAILPTRRLPQPLVDGTALIEAGLRPGPGFRELLDLALDAQIEGRIATAEEGLALVREAAARAGDGRGQRPAGG
ncbi:MAG: hypothetical protein ACKOYN_08885, partial [Planctomycetota bacterium]